MSPRPDAEASSAAATRSPSDAHEDARDLSGDSRGLWFTKRLRRLYEISVLLTLFESVETTVPAVIALLAQALPLHSAILILNEGDGKHRTIVWQAEGESVARLTAAKAHARAAQRYLAHSEVDAVGDSSELRALPPSDERAPQATTRVEGNFIHLPLVVARQPVFGALQLEGSSPFDELDLIFVNAVANQMAIAIDRQAVISAKQASAEEREREQHLLADVSELVGSSPDYRDRLVALARAAVPRFADLCLIDEAADDGSFERREIVWADEPKARDSSERLREISLGSELRAAALESGKPLLVGTLDALRTRAIASAEEVEVFGALGITSLMLLPLVARGQTLGVLTFATTEPSQPYTTDDLGFAGELARRSAIALDNARLYEQAKRATLARDNLLALVSHDLRNPLGVILMHLSLMRSHPADALPRGPLEVMERAAKRMHRLIDDLLQTASIEAGRLSIEPRRLALAPLVAEAVEALQLQAAAKSLHLVNEVPAELPAVEADGPRLQQVLANLLGNAVKFTPPDGTITIRSAVADDEVTVSIADTGPGIAEDELAHIFDRFWQARRTARLGTGLGLFIVKGIVESHRGRVWVESKPGEGSTFSFTVPVSKRTTENYRASQRGPARE